MEDCPFEEMIDFLKKDDLPELDLGQTDLSRSPDSSLVDEFMNDPQFWNTFLNEKEVLKQNISKYSTSDFNPESWINPIPSPPSTNNYASSSAGSEHSGSSPSYLSEICTTVSTDSSVVHLDSNSSYQANASPFLDDDSSRAAEVTSPCLSNYDSSVSGIDIGADVIVVTTSEVYAEEEVGDSDDAIMEEIYVEEDGLKPLKLSEEEKRLMAKEGVVLPKYLPLTKAEEKELKRIRRKIRNKASAQNSRKRKKEYIDGLEKRVKRCTLENNVLKQTIRQMQDRNKSLVAELSRLQKIVGTSVNKPVQSSTTLMVLLCSFALLLLPNLVPSALERKDLFDGKKSDQKMPPVAGRSRTLLSSPTVWDKGRAEPLYREDNISNLYESIPPSTSPKLAEWGLAAGQQVAKAPFQMSDAVTTFPKDFLAPQKNCVVDDDSGPLQLQASVWSVDSPPPCVQEVVIDSSPD